MEEPFKVGKIVEIVTANDKVRVTIETGNYYFDTKKETIEVLNCSFQVGDVVRFDETNIEKSPGKKDMNYSEYDYIKKQIFTLSEEELKRYHEIMVGQMYEHNKEYEKTDFANFFMRDIIQYNYGYCIVKEGTEDLSNFMNSKYTSEVIKKRIYSALFQEEISEIDKWHMARRRAYYERTGNFDSQMDIVNANNWAVNFLQSDKELKDLSGAEIHELEIMLKKYAQRSEKQDVELYSTFYSLIFNLKSKGAKDYLNQYADKIALAKHILSTSGLNSRADYYSGRGTNEGDLNAKHLIEIFNKLFKINVKKAIAMFKLVEDMETLGATEFINSFLKLADTDFEYSIIHYGESEVVNNVVRTNNMEITEACGKERDMISLIGLVGRCFGNCRDSLPLTSKIKKEFQYGIMEKYRDLGLAMKIEVDPFEDEEGLRR